MVLHLIIEDPKMLMAGYFDCKLSKGDFPSGTRRRMQNNRLYYFYIQANFYYFQTVNMKPQNAVVIEADMIKPLITTT